MLGASVQGLWPSYPHLSQTSLWTRGLGLLADCVVRNRPGLSLVGSLAGYNGVCLGLLILTRSHNG